MIWWVLLILTSLPLHQGGIERLFQFRLIAPTAGIDSPLTRFYLDGESWAIDPWETRTGHLQGTGWLNGNVVLGGHMEYPDGEPGVFGALNKIKLGDRLVLTVGGFSRHYTVAEIRAVPETDLSVVYPTADNRLTLITCDEASFNPRTGLYSERLVVIAVERQPTK
jgi:LPXTG-site transpeptidase (sortase) family protein